MINFGDFLKTRSLQSNSITKFKYVILSNFQTQCTWPVKPFSTICQTFHFKQRRWINFEPLPQWETGNLKALCLQPLTSLSKIAMNFRSLLVSNSLYKQDCASGWLTCPAAWVKRLSVIIHFYKLEEQEGFFRPPICWQRDFIGYISLAFLLNSSLFYEK